MLQSFATAVLVQAAKELLKDAESRAFLIQLAQRFANQLSGDLLPKLLALFPMFSAASLNEFVDLLRRAGGINVPGLPPVGELAERIREVANGEIPDVDVPGLSDAVKTATGFDLTDFLNKLGRR